MATSGQYSGYTTPIALTMTRDLVELENITYVNDEDATFNGIQYTEDGTTNTLKIYTRIEDSEFAGYDIKLNDVTVASLGDTLTISIVPPSVSMTSTTSSMSGGYIAINSYYVYFSATYSCTVTYMVDYTANDINYRPIFYTSTTDDTNYGSSASYSVAITSAGTATDSFGYTYNIPETIESSSTATTHKVAAPSNLSAEVVHAFFYRNADASGGTGGFTGPTSIPSAGGYTHTETTSSAVSFGFTDVPTSGISDSSSYVKINTIAHLAVTNA